MPLNNENTGSIQASDGTTLFYREWRHAEPRGAIVLVHGLGEHGGRYAELAILFHDAGLSVRIHDHRGHGKSGGARGSLRSDADFLTDLKLVFDHFAQQCNTTPFIFGHSLGGLVAARFATGGLSKVRGLLLSSPALAIRMSGFQKILLSLTTRLAPGFAVPTSLPAELVSHDTEVVQRYHNDPLNHGKVAARVVNFMLSAMAQVQRDAGTFTLPLLLHCRSRATMRLWIRREAVLSFRACRKSTNACIAMTTLTTRFLMNRRSVACAFRAICKTGLRRIWREVVGERKQIADFCCNAHGVSRFAIGDLN